MIFLQDVRTIAELSNWLIINNHAVADIFTTFSLNGYERFQSSGWKSKRKIKCEKNKMY